MGFTDGITNVLNNIANARNALAINKITPNRILTDAELTAIYESGLGNKISKIKSSYSTYPENFIFENDDDVDFYRTIQSKIKEAVQWAIVFGRGIIVVSDGTDLSKPKQKVTKIKSLSVISGEQVSVSTIDTDLSSPRYLKPILYNINGKAFHYTNIIDITYIAPTFNNLSSYKYGGMSEFQLINNQLINDGLIEKASASIIEKNSSFFYKIKGFKDALTQKRDDDIVKFFLKAENARSIYGAGLIDSDDDVLQISQTLANLRDVNELSLRRVAMVTGIPLPILVGESVSGLNSQGKQERNTFNDMIFQIENDYVLPAINLLFEKLGKGIVKINPTQSISAMEKAEFEAKTIDNASKLFAMGYDATRYLKENGIKYQDDLDLYL